MDALGDQITLREMLNIMAEHANSESNQEPSLLKQHCQTLYLNVSHIPECYRNNIFCCYESHKNFCKHFINVNDWEV